jgi:hypothetical protein
MITIDDEKVRQLGKDPADFRRVPASLKSKYGDKILAGTEFGHHIHCLVRKRSPQVYCLLIDAIEHDSKIHIS